MCVTTTAWYMGCRANIIFTDVLLLVLPLPIVIRLRVGWVVKMGLVAMFSLGFLCVLGGPRGCVVMVMVLILR